MADGEIAARPAAKNGFAVAAALPEVDGPRIATTFLSEMYFCASACAGAGPCSTGVSPRTSLTFRPYCFGSVWTAYLAQLACSVPRNPAPPVSGVRNGMVIVLAQLIDCDEAAETATLWAPCALAATTEVMRTARARPIAFFI